MVMETVVVVVYAGAMGDPPMTSKIMNFYFLENPLITAPANVTGVPAASVRSGFSRNGMPMAFQVTGRLFDDATVLKVAHAYEAATPDQSFAVGDSP
jgi:aspartyl-tRNA(Asn)/glutamyl-tRNA(Gln) amidotransferase subunit A